MRIGHHSKERITLTPSKVRQPVGQMGKDQKTLSQIPCRRQLLTIGSLTDRFSIFPYFSDTLTNLMGSWWILTFINYIDMTNHIYISKKATNISLNI